MIKPSSIRQPKPEGSADGQGILPGWGILRRVRVKAFGGETATVVVRVVHGYVWLSISPPFTWEAIMEPGMVDEVMRVLELARDEARQTGMPEAGLRGAKVVQEIGKARSGRAIDSD